MIIGPTNSFVILTQFLRGYNVPHKIIKHFIKFLIREGIYLEYNTNFLNQTSGDITPFYDALKHRKSDIVNATLIWEYTIEGEIFWMNVNNHWCEYIKPYINN